MTVVFFFLRISIGAGRSKFYFFYLLFVCFEIALCYLVFFNSVDVDNIIFKPVITIWETKSFENSPFPIWRLNGSSTNTVNPNWWVQNKSFAN
jgi:hypothetical protein